MLSRLKKKKEKKKFILVVSKGKAPFLKVKRMNANIATSWSEEVGGCFAKSSTEIWPSPLSDASYIWM